MKKLLIPLVAIILLAGGGAFFFLGGEKHEPATGDEDHANTAPAKERYFVELEPITATIFRDDQPAGNFTAAFTLEVAKADMRSNVAERRRQLRDAMFLELHAMFEREEFTGRKVDVTAVKGRMLAISRHQLGEEVVVDLFVKTLLRKGA